MRRRDKPCYARMEQRRVWARERGCSGKQARVFAARIGEFRAFVVSLGLDPDTLGDFARNMGPGGHPRIDTPRSRAFKRVYHELRALGATSEQATEGARSLAGLARIKRELSGSVFRQEAKP
jgi:hypothetical protein